ncbi:hypothetical protein L596_018349 [Steinernema carpocapsae]|uniref:Secreted protein n=1 Tax=Steinernema carpocapsae TaxID=34508 RepID=A0A4V6A202_STECR|nr:hypothetical protein L596_018349 [Steinernema carpocapsae]
MSATRRPAKSRTRSLLLLLLLCSLLHLYQRRLILNDNFDVTSANQRRNRLGKRVRKICSVKSFTKGI